MYLKKAFLLALFVALSLVACSDIEDEILYREDAAGVRFSPTKLQGTIDYLPAMALKYVKVINVDEQLNPVDSFEVSVDSGNSKNRAFEVASRDYEYPIVKIVPVFEQDNGTEMEFPQYVRLDKRNDNLKLNLFEALAAERTEELVREKDCSFDSARIQAVAELIMALDIIKEKEEASRLASDMSEYYSLMLMKKSWTFIYCQYEISDSLFYKTFEELRKDFAKKGSVDSSFLVHAADVWLSTFKVVTDKNGYVKFKSVSRDSSVGANGFNSEFFASVYGIQFLWNENSPAKIDNKLSQFNGRKFIYDKSESLWRLAMPLDDSLGICYSRKDSIVVHEGKYYRCAKGSVEWKEETDRDTILKQTYGTCGSAAMNIGRAGYVGDSLFVCTCEDKKCAWTDKYAKSVIKKDDPIYPSYVIANAIREFGLCGQKMYGEIKKVNDDYVLCSKKDNKWEVVDSLDYYLGMCSEENAKGEHQGVYYACKDYEEYGVVGGNWSEIPEPAYLDEDCHSIEVGALYVKKYGDYYFACYTRTKLDKNGYSKSVTFWNKLDSAEAIPPVINMDVCNSDRENLKVIYDGAYYECDNRDLFYRWYPVEKDSLLPPERDGHICTPDLYGTVKKYGDAYYECGYVNQWREMPAVESALLYYRDSLGSCDTISKKSLYWNEKSSSFFGCLKGKTGYDWTQIYLAPGLNYTMPKSFEKRKFAGGMVERDSAYTVTVDGVAYRFSIFEKNWPLSHVVIAGKGYDAYFYNERLFLHSERGTEQVHIDSIKNKSESYDGFFASWKSWAKKCSECSDTTIAVDTSVYVARYNEDAFMNWMRASAFCPEGFHIPSSEEFMQDDFVAYKTYDMTIRNDTPVLWNYKMNKIGCNRDNTIFFDIFWTSSEKDKKTQQCYEAAWHIYKDEKDRRIVDCPKDLYPMVQTLCVQDD